ncbi:MAG: hypothetical protein ABH840_00435 [Nanoarchaeota archaeon]
MICYYYEEEGISHVIVPYVFSARVEGGSVRIFLNPNRLERITERLIENRDIIEEKVKIGQWTKLKLDGEGLREICSLCFGGNTYEAGRIAVGVCQEVMEFIHTDNY